MRWLPLVLSRCADHRTSGLVMIPWSDLPPERLSTDVTPNTELPVHQMSARRQVGFRTRCPQLKSAIVASRLRISGLMSFFLLGEWEICPRFL